MATSATIQLHILIRREKMQLLSSSKVPSKVLNLEARSDRWEQWVAPF
jgi:hypothetical protein